MTISPPLIPDHGPFNELANRLARELSTAFGYSLLEAEEHIRRPTEDFRQRPVCGPLNRSRRALVLNDDIAEDESEHSGLA